MKSLHFLITQKLDEICREPSYLNRLISQIESISNTIQHIVIYGIGNISLSTISRHQLAMIYLISKALLIKAICIWDPVITDEEWEYYGSLKFQRASYPFMEGENTFYYMPHCDLPVYEGLLTFQNLNFVWNNLILIEYEIFRNLNNWHQLLTTDSLKQ